MSHFVYILQSLKDFKYYIGETSDVERRLQFHNAGKQRSTRTRIPFRLVLVEEYSDRIEALKREKELKSWKGGIKFKIFIQGMEPRLAGHHVRDVGVAGSNPVIPTALEHPIKYRKATIHDVPAMAHIRSREWETEEFWAVRVLGYMQGKLSPGDALPPRILYVAIDRDVVVGLIAGHLTTRLQCNGELQWINVLEEYRGNGIASVLLRLLATWFVEQNALRVCVDPDNEARKFYAKHGATNLNQHWLVWNDISIVLKSE